MSTTRRDPRAERGHVRTRGGSHQVIVYAGVDPVTGKEVFESESTRDPKKIPAIRSKLLAKVDKQRNASTSASLSYLRDEWLEVHEIDYSTRDSYVGYIARTI